MSLAGIVNISMLVTAAAVFHSRGLTEIGDDLTGVHTALGDYLGGSASALFGIALLASGLSSSSVGTLAGQVVMQGFINRQIPLFLRRFVTMIPALVVHRRRCGSVARARNQPGRALVRGSPSPLSRFSSSAAIDA